MTTPEARLASVWAALHLWAERLANSHTRLTDNGVSELGRAQEAPTNF